MQVTRSMFDKVLPHVERAIEQCQFYAFDLEMTGLHVSDQRESWVDDMEDRYRVVGSCLGLIAFKAGPASLGHWRRPCSHVLST